MNRTGRRYAALITTHIHCSTNRRPLCGQAGNLIPAYCINQIKKKLTFEKQPRSSDLFVAISDQKQPRSGDLFVAPGIISDQIKPRSGDLFVAPGIISDQIKPHSGDPFVAISDQKQPRSGDLNISENGKYI